jgi:heme/copper-type cytochrome/quinol oxidase subunit 3
MAAEPVVNVGHDEHVTNFGVPNEKMGMWTLIGSECLFFGALITTYLIYLNRYEPGPTAGRSSTSRSRRCRRSSCS